jgi:hypothetical protein
LYFEDLFAVGCYLSSLTKDPAWSNEEFSRIKKKSTKYFVKEGFLWRRRQKRESPFRVVGDEESRRKVLAECYDAGAPGHKGIQSTYERIILLYWWPGI